MNNTFSVVRKWKNSKIIPHFSFQNNHIGLPIIDKMLEAGNVDSKAYV